jgi:hypothetical protein
MRQQINEIKEIQKHPIKNILQNASDILKEKVAEIRAQLGKIRENIVQGCKNAVTAVKEVGITALDKLADFFHIKQGFEAIQTGSAAGVKSCDKAVGNIEIFSKEYHSATLSVKNMARLAIGRQRKDTPAEIGKLAKVVCLPYKVGRKCLDGIGSTADKAVVKLDELGKSTEQIKQERQERKDPAKDAHLAIFEEKAKKINAVNADRNNSKVLAFKPKQEEAVI